MTKVAGTKTITSSPTSFEVPAGLGTSAWLANIIVHNRPEHRPLGNFDLGLATGPGLTVEQVPRRSFAEFKDVASLAAGFKAIWLPIIYTPSPMDSGAETSAPITEHSLRRLLRAERRNELLQRLSPERRATYERIRRLREEIGPLGFDIIEELRELRENG